MTQPQTYPITNPRTGALLYGIEDAAPEAVAGVFAAARAAQECLRAGGLRARMEALGRLKARILNAMESIAERIVEETGKPQTEALTLEVIHVLDTIAWYEKNAAKILADRKVKNTPFLAGKKSRIFFEPLGTVLIIAPWNYPFGLTLIPALSAFLAGNAVIVKPSECAPLKGLIEGLLRESGFPENAIQIVYGGPPAAERLIDAGPEKIFFTGGPASARKVLARAAAGLIPVDLELGGKDPAIVFADADLERAADAAVWSAMANAGQTCISAERLYVQDSAYEEFLRLLKEKAERLRAWGAAPARADSREIDVGCMTTARQLGIVEELVADAVSRGARVLTGGTRVPDTRAFAPTILADVTPAMRIQREELMGPVLAAAPFRDEDEAVALANDSVYGLSASVWSGDAQQAERVARRLAAGGVSINNALLTVAHPGLPFGGVKQSGFGRTKGEWGLHAFCNIKAVVIDRPHAFAEPHWFPYTRAKTKLLMKMTRLFFGRDPLKWLKMFRPGMRFLSLLRKRR